MIVTVQVIKEHSRDITAEMVRAFLLRRQWDESVIASMLGRTWFYSSPLADTVVEIAEHLDRKPHEVLADIAEGR